MAVVPMTIPSAAGRMTIYGDYVAHAVMESGSRWHIQGNQPDLTLCGSRLRGDLHRMDLHVSLLECSKCKSLGERLSLKTAPDAAGIEAALAAGLAAHGGWVCDRVGDGWRCWCGVSLLDYWPAGGVTPRDTALSAAHRAHVAAALLPVVTQAQAEALYAARDALYRGEGPDAYADADLLYGEWLGNRADESGA